MAAHRPPEPENFRGDAQRGEPPSPKFRSAVLGFEVLRIAAAAEKLVD
jgi:hypothetical protein